MKTVLILCICWFGFSVAAQPTYQRMFNFYGAWEDALYLYKYDTVNQSIKIHGMTGNPFDTIYDSVAYRQIYFATIDSTGTVTYLKNYGKNKLTYLVGNSNLSHDINDTLTKTIIEYFDTANNYTHQLWYVNTNTMDTLFSKNMNIPPKYVTGDVLTVGNKYYFMGNIGSTVGDRMFFLVTDTAGNLLINKMLPPNYVGNYTNLKITENKNILVGGRYQFDRENIYTIYGWYALLDTLGNIIWDVKCNDSNTLRVQTNIWVNKSDNGEYFISGAEIIDGPGAFDPETNSSYIGKIDITNGKIIWLKKFLSFANNTEPILATYTERNGSFYGYGTYAIETDTENEVQYGMLVKLDLEGNLKWKRLYKEWRYSNRLWGMHFIKDGFILLGDAKDTTHTTGYADAWIIKTDTFGCVVPGCQLYDNIPQIIAPKISFLVYPNPSNSTVLLSYKSKQATPLNINIVDITGKLIYTTTSNALQSTVSIETTTWTNGMYIIQLIGDGELLGSQKLIVQH